MANIQVNQLPESSDISGEDLVHIKKVDLVDYKMKQKNLMIIGIQDTKVNLEATNPVLKRGQFSRETDTGVVKLGDGTTPYNLLGFFGDLQVHPSIITSDFIAELDTIYFVDTDSGVVNVTMPTPVNSKNRIVFIDYRGSWNTNNVNLEYNINKYNGFSEDFFLDLKWASVDVRWSGNNTIGWRTY